MSSMAHHILNQLSIDTDQKLKMLLLNNTHVNENDWELGFQYIKHFSESADRFVRRAAIRKLHQVIDTPVERTMDAQRDL